MPENYPVGIQSFAELIGTESIYVDKTPLIYSLLQKKGIKNYFLSRPRRFGKSLLLNTFKAIFQGKQELFQGLYIYDKITWEANPIIHLSMAEISFADMGLVKALKNSLQEMARNEKVVFTEDTPGRMFRQLIQLLYEKYGKKVVVLIDEYDKPIIHGLEAGNSDVAEANRDILKNFYGALKDADDYLRFMFITGVSKFAKISIFSDLNHLTDLTLAEDYTTICGYSQVELEHYFPEGLQKLAKKYNMTMERCLAKMKDWYDGFSWDGENFLYNPFSTLQLLASAQFSNYWFATGTPTFLVRMMAEKQEYLLENLKVRPEIFETFDLRKLDYKSLLLQTGYLAIKGRVMTEEEIDYYIVSFPNKEVKESFNQMLLGDFIDKSRSDAGISVYNIRDAFVENDLKKVKLIIQAMFHSLPVHLFEKKDRDGNTKPVGENFYHAIIYLIFNLLGVKMQAEVVVFPPLPPQIGGGGGVDAVVETTEHIYLFEFKKDQSPELAIEQIKTNEYFGKYSLSNKIIHLVGVRFSLEKRGIDAENDWAEEIL